MTGRARRLWFVIHSWLGLTCGLLLFVVCWSGTMAVFSHEIDWLIDKRIQATSAPADLKWQKIQDSVKARYLVGPEFVDPLIRFRGSERQVRAEIRVRF